MHGKAAPPRRSSPPPRDALTFDYENEAKVRGKDEEQKKINRLLYN